MLQSITGSVCKNKSENQFHHYPNNGQSISQEAFALTEYWERFWPTKLDTFQENVAIIKTAATPLLIVGLLITNESFQISINPRLEVDL